MDGLNNMVDAPLDGSHLMIVFNDTEKTHKIREAWVKTCSECQITGIFEYESDIGGYVEIEHPLGWFPIPECFNVDVITWQ